MRKCDKSHLADRIKTTFAPKSTTPHVLVELSRIERKRLAANTIHLSGVISCDTSKTIHYNSVTYGTNVRKRKAHIMVDNTSVPTYQIAVESMKRNLIVITLSKEDAVLVFPDLITSKSIFNCDPSGVVLLLACTYCPISKQSKTWKAEDFSKVKQCKPNILQNSNHHQSNGYYASFGNKGSYEKISSSSVGQYTTKRVSKLCNQQVLNKNANLYESLCANEISRAVSALKIFVPNIKYIIAPVLETSYELQLEEKELNIKETPSIADGCWQSSICVNAETKQMHTEHDCTYTLISIPKQVIPKDTKCFPKYDFLFKLTNNQSINISLKPGISFMFSGLFLTHRQNKSKVTQHDKMPFFNMASYGNKRLFHHIRKTYNRNK